MCHKCVTAPRCLLFQPFQTGLVPGPSAYETYDSTAPEALPSFSAGREPLVNGSTLRLLVAEKPSQWVVSSITTVSSVGLATSSDRRLRQHASSARPASGVRWVLSIGFKLRYELAGLAPVLAILRSALVARWVVLPANSAGLHGAKAVDIRTIRLMS
jgi:hypothetical protein